MISFQNPAGLLLLPLAAAPLVIHWLQRERAKVISFPSVQLLKAVPSRSWRRDRIRQWMLLAARVMLLLCLILLISGPRAHLNLPTWLVPSEGSLVIIIDDSASMSAREGAVFQQAKDEASRAVAGLGGNSQVAIISGSMGHRVLSGLASPGRSGSAIDTSAPSETGTDLTGALLVADRMLEGKGGATIIVFSDLMKHGFGPHPLPLLRSGAGISLVQCGGDGAPNNLCWQRVDHYPLKGRLLAQGRATGRSDLEISLMSGDRVVAKAAAHPDSEGVFSISLAWDGAGQAFLQGPPDGLPVDDRYYLAPGGAQGMDVLLLEAGLRPSHLKRALDALAGAGYRVQARSPAGGLTLSRYGLIILSGPAVTVPARDLIAAVENGSGLLLVPSADAQPQSYNRLLAGLHPEISLGEITSGSDLRLILATDQVFPGISSRDLRHVSVSRYWRLAGRNAGPLMVQGGGPGYLTFKFGGGQVGLWLLGTGPEMTDIGYHPIFLPMLDQICRQMSGAETGQYFAGSFVSSPGMKGLIGPDGRAVPPIVSEGGRASWSLDRAGWYRAQLGNAERLLAANIPPEESQLIRMSQQDLEEAMGPNHWYRGLSGGLPSGGSRPLTKPLLMLAGLLLMLELAVRGIGKNILKKRLTT